MAAPNSMLHEPTTAPPMMPARADRTDPTSDAAASLFVGRERELRALASALGHARGGHGSLWLVAGEPGIGKTRLASEYAERARANGAVVLWGSCWEAGGAPSYWPWVEIIRQVVRLDPTPVSSVLGRHAQHLAQLAPDLMEQLGTTQAPPPADPDSARFFVFDAVARLLRHVATERPLVVVIDDFHAADRVSILLLVFLARTLTDAGVVLIGTYRDAEAALSTDLVAPLAELARAGNRLALRGLGASDVGRLIEGRAHARPSPAFVAHILGVTDGNPFYIDEILRLLASEKRLDSVDVVPHFAVPDGIRDTVLRRLGSLPAESHEVLGTAAVIGRAFDLAVLRSAASLDAIAVLRALEEPMRHGVVVQAPGSTDRFAFRHALIREVLYEQLGASDRLLLHRRIGEAFEQLAAGNPDAYAPELAHHFLAAAPGSSDDRFVAHGTRAARYAMRRMAFEEAVALYERILAALTTLPPDERRRAELLLALAEAREWSNDVRGSRGAAEEVAAIARRLDAPDLLARAALSVGAIHALKSTATSRFECAGELLREAVKKISPSDVATRARIESRLAVHHLSNDGREKAVQMSAKAVADARSSGDCETLALALIARHAVLLGPDHIDERWAIAQEILELADQMSSHEFAMRGHALQVVNSLDMGEIRAARDALERHARVVAQTADPFERWASLSWRANLELLAGHFDEAARLADEALQLGTSVPGLHSMELNGDMGHAGHQVMLYEARYAGTLDPATVDYYRAHYPEVAVWHLAHLHQLTRQGLVEETRRELDALRPALVNLDRGTTWLAAMAFLADSIALVDDRELARAVYTQLLPYADRNATISLIACRGSMSGPLGLLAATLGRRDDAIRHFEAALEMNRRMGARPRVAITLLDYGTSLARWTDDDSRRRAIELVRESQALADELGMPGLVQKCTTFLENMGIAPTLARPRSNDFQLEKDGGFWTLSRGAARVTLQDCKGLTYIAELLRRPGCDVHALDLLDLFHDPDRAPAASAEPGATTSRAGFADDVIDDRARRAYERQLDDLEAQVAAADRDGDPERALALRDDIAALERELSRAVGLGGRVRRASDAERARISVTRAIRLALGRVAEAAPTLGAELAGRVRTGTCCRYDPTPTSA